MRILLAIVSLLIAAAPAAAISRYNAWTLSCAEARGIVRAEGAVILRFRSKINPSIPRFGRFVADGRFCTPGEYAAYTSIPTADDPSCPVRECQAIDYDDDFFLWRRFR
jgi:hypothetical protein